ncbi:hypothetical protein FRB94_011890 [Tulasnella sp. JGI-2019a]|nr:hypothetical protein FRB94_011890 [Tulasnella sp. JGI-2019a]
MRCVYGAGQFSFPLWRTTGGRNRSIRPCPTPLAGGRRRINPSCHTWKIPPGSRFGFPHTRQTQPLTLTSTVVWKLHRFAMAWKKTCLFINDLYVVQHTSLPMGVSGALDA